MATTSADDSGTSCAVLMKNLESSDEESGDENVHPNSSGQVRAAGRARSYSMGSLESDDDNVDIETAANNNDNGDICAAERHFVEKGRTLRTLVTLCRGILDDDGNQLIDANAEPWCQIKPEKQVKPTNAEYVDEIRRRWKEFAGIPTNFKAEPAPKKWKTAQLLEWLDKNPVVDAANVAYLKAMAKEYKTSATEAARERAELANDLDESGKNWNSDILLMRLMHVIIENDNIKRAYLTRLDISNDRLDLDNRNSVDMAAPTCWEMISDTFNDPGYNTTSNRYPLLHSNFRVPRDLSYAAVKDYKEANPALCKRKIEEMVRDVGVVKGRYEASGVGDNGKRHDEDSDVGSDDESDGEIGEVDTRQNFLWNEPPITLYLWKLFEKHGLLQSSLQVLNTEVSSSNGADGVPSVAKKRKNSNGTESTSSGAKSKKGKSDVSSARMDHSGIEKSIASIGSSFLASAELDAVEREKDRNAQMAIETMKIDRERERETIKSIRGNIDSLRKEKKELGNQLDDEEAAEKPRARCIARITKEIDDIERRIAADEKSLMKLERREEL